LNENLLFAGLSDRGRIRSRNEDEWYANSEMGVFVVSDGMGGQSAGDLSAKVVVTSLPSMLRRNMEDVEDLEEPEVPAKLMKVLAELSELLHTESRHEPALKGMGATVALTMIRRAKALIGHIGDSRVYLLRDEKLSRLTKDHSLVQILVDFGEITPEQAAIHPIRGQITQFVGMPGEALPEVQLLHLKHGDRLMLCSDGLTEMLPDREIENLLLECPLPDTACEVLVNAASEEGGRDNITVIVIDWAE